MCPPSGVRYFTRAVTSEVFSLQTEISPDLSTLRSQGLFVVPSQPYAAHAKGPAGPRWPAVAADLLVGAGDGGDRARARAHAARVAAVRRHGDTPRARPAGKPRTAYATLQLFCTMRRCSLQISDHHSDSKDKNPANIRVDSGVEPSENRLSLSPRLSKRRCVPSLRILKGLT